VLATLGDRLLALPAGVALTFVFLLPALESSAFLGFVFPGEIAVVIGGVLASQGKFPLWAAIAAAVVGAILGDSIGYEVGKHWGDRLLRGSIGRLPLIHKELDKHLDSATAFVRRRGPHAVFVGRFTTALRVLVPGLAGMAELPYPQFLLFNALGAIVWGTGFVLLGYFAGAAWERFAADASHVGLVLLAMVFLGLVGVRLYRRVRDERHLAPDRLAEVRIARWFRLRYPRLSAWLALRVDTTSERGLSFSVVAVGGALLMWVYAALIQDVVWNDDAALRDPQITAWFVAHRTSSMTALLQHMTWFGSSVVLAPLIVIVGGALWWRRHSAVPLASLVVVWAAAWGAAALTKQLVDRPRPPTADWLVGVQGPSFPSQHAAASAAVCGMVVFLLVPGLSWGRRTAVVSAAVVVTVLVCVSRVYLGVHWCTDVVAGASLGAALVLIAAAATVWARGDVRVRSAG
jgi:membrane protein DedA with SNARE-associated domain/membrane-associated phospholipid phosphatase